MKIVVFWFRRDLRLEDNTGLWHALNSGFPVLPLFIFDTHIIQELAVNDARIYFIYQKISELDSEIKTNGGSLKLVKSMPEDAFARLLNEFEIHAVYANRDEEPYAIMRDDRISMLLAKSGIHFHLYKDQVIFEKREVLKPTNEPYTIYTPYKNKWVKESVNKLVEIKQIHPHLKKVYQYHANFPDMAQLGFQESGIRVRPYRLDTLANYAKTRDIPAEDGTSYLGPHLRFGTISIRQVISQLNNADSVFLNELIWREFFMQIMAHFPHVVVENFKPAYNHIKWRNNPEEFERWCRGETGYPLVDAGMRQLNETGYMHNRVRMVAASFLCKHLLIDWRWGEAYFARKLLDYELSSNNGNWQWAAGTGCDAAPYFRVFNPSIQQKKFDPKMEYIRNWVSEIETAKYPLPMVEHVMARARAIACYKEGLNRT